MRTLTRLNSSQVNTESAGFEPCLRIAKNKKHLTSEWVILIGTKLRGYLYR